MPRGETHGRGGKRQGGYRNFLELVSVFTSPPLFAVKHGSREVGAVHQLSFVAHDRDRPVLSLAGHSWTVTRIDWTRRVAYVQPAPGQTGRSRWLGGGQALSYALCQAMQEVLAADTDEEYFSRRTKEALRAMREEFCWVDARSTVVVSTPSGGAQWWTFGGLLANAAIGQYVRSVMPVQLKWDNLAITLDGDMPAEQLSKTIQSTIGACEIDTDVPVDDKAIDRLKFSACLPPELAQRSLQLRLSDGAALRSIVSRPVIAMAGDRVVHLDNLEGTFGNDTLDRALTTTRWKDRILGKSQQIDLPLLPVWYGTGNNVAVAADTTRRIIHIRLDVLEERPEERTGFRRPDLLGWVRANRPRLLARAMTILVAYCKAERPSQDLTPFGSFEGWSRLVREAVVWAGLLDPCRTRTRLLPRAAYWLNPDLEPEMAPELVKRYILQRVANLGWTGERFDDFDGDVFDVNRGEHKAERIGKKYQWIGYHEALARLSDSVVFRGEGGIYCGAWQTSCRDIDPSFLLRQTPRQQWRHDATWWNPLESSLVETEAGDLAWLRDAQSLPDPLRMIKVRDPENREWYVVSAYASRDNRSDPDEAKLDLPVRRMWYTANAYIVHRRHISAVAKWGRVRKVDSVRIPEVHAMHELFYGEYPWAPAFADRRTSYYGREDWRDDRVFPVPVMLPTDVYSRGGSGYDCSIEDDIRVELPSVPLIESLGLTSPHMDGRWYDGEGTLVAWDPSVTLKGPSALLIRPNVLTDLLKRKDWDVFWFVRGEKQWVSNSTSREDWPGMLVYQGVFTRSRGQVIGAPPVAFPATSENSAWPPHSCSVEDLRGVVVSTRETGRAKGFCSSNQTPADRQNPWMTLGASSACKPDNGDYEACVRNGTGGVRGGHRQLQPLGSGLHRSGRSCTHRHQCAKQRPSTRGLFDQFNVRLDVLGAFAALSVFGFGSVRPAFLV